VVAIFQRGTSLLENMMFISESPVMRIQAYEFRYIPNSYVFLHIQRKFIFGNISETVKPCFVTFSGRLAFFFYIVAILIDPESSGFAVLQRDLILKPYVLPK